MQSYDVVEQLVELQKEPDREEAHVKADRLLCAFLNDLGYHDIVRQYNRIHKWYA